MTSLVLGNLPFTSQGGDQLVSKAVTAAISALFKRTGKLEATVRAEPVSKLLQGSVDGFDFVGNGMLMYNGLRIEAMELYVQAVSIDFGAIFKGQVTLRQPTQATMRVVLTETDLTNSFNTPFVVEKLEQLQYQGQSLHFQNTKMTFNDDKSLRIQSEVLVGDRIKPWNLDVTAQVEVEDRRKIQFVNVNYQGDDNAVALGKAVIEHVNSLLDLDKFALEGTQLRVDKVRIRKQDLIFYGTAQISQFPQRRR
ncbi:MAG: DUF2993 domain-containing protein [Leptolyngbya sp. SIO4C1]|nr:DUF2993 domain-containing protein [Leptolyngbya sp. SIO4C1]